MADISNRSIAEMLREIGEHLEMQDVPFKPRAFEKAAEMIGGLGDEVAEIYKKGGLTALREIPSIGASISEKIEEFIKTGEVRELEGLRRKVPVNLAELSGIEGLSRKRSRSSIRSFASRIGRVWRKRFGRKDSEPRRLWQKERGTHRAKFGISSIECPQSARRHHAAGEAPASIFGTGARRGKSDSCGIGAAQERDDWRRRFSGGLPKTSRSHECVRRHVGCSERDCTRFDEILGKAEVGRERRLAGRSCRILWRGAQLFHWFKRSQCRVAADLH